VARIHILAGALVLLAGCASTDVPSADKPPEWKPGYTWTWHSSADDGERYPVLLRMEVLRYEKISSLEGWLVDWNVTGASTWLIPTPELVNATTMASHAVAMHFPYFLNSCPEFGIIGHPPPDFLRFPLTPGKSWVDSERLLTATDGRLGTFYLQAKVIGPEPITVAGKRYDDAVRVEHIYWVASEKEGDRPTKPDATLTKEPTVFHYSPSVQNFVRVETPTSGAFYSPPGERVSAYTFDMLPDGFGLLELTSAKLIERPPDTKRHASGPDCQKR